MQPARVQQLAFSSWRYACAAATAAVHFGEGCNGRGKQAATAAALPLRLPRSALKGEIRQDFVLQCTPCLPPLRGGTIDFKYFLELYCSLSKLRFKARLLSRNLEKVSCACLTYGLKELMFRRQ